MNRSVRMLLSVVLASGIIAGPAFGTILVTQTNFSLGYGEAVTFGSPFTTNETSSANTPTTAPNPDGSSFTMGNFTFTVTTANLATFGSGGPGFPNRVLTDSGGVVNGNSIAGFTVTIDAVYTGAFPPSPDLKDPAFSLAIDQISIYGLKYPDYGTTNEAYWTETTAGHTGVSPSVFLTESAGFAIAANYQQVLWDPGDWQISGTNITRTFRLPLGVDYFPVIDGLEIIGSAFVIADVPEPGTALLFGLGGCVLAWWWRRRG